MRSACLVAALAGLAHAVPRPAPQDINFGEIDVRSPPSQACLPFTDPNQTEDAPTLTGPPVDAVSQPVAYNEKAAKASAAAQVTDDLSSPTKRGLAKRGVNDPCSPQLDGYGPKPAVDTVDAFLGL